MDADVLIQAGHEGKKRNKGSGTTASVGASGIAQPEHQMTPKVANAAEKVLKDHGVSVIRANGVFPQAFEVKLGLALHFDGSPSKCGSGASVGYPPGNPVGSNKPTADLWKQIYGEFWPFRFMKDNFTPNLSGYYGYRFMKTSIAEMLIEFGEVSCPKQDEWLQPRLDWLGGVVAHFAGRVISVDIPKPLPFGETAPAPVARTVQVDAWDSDIADVRLELSELRAQVNELSALVGGASADEAADVARDDDL
jgi:hypothetical protein